MDIGKKIEEVFGQMKQRPMLMDKFYELESMEQVYEFFHSIRGGYTKQEFMIIYPISWMNWTSSTKIIVMMKLT